MRAIASGGVGDELIALPALRFLADVLPAGALEVRLGDFRRRHRVFELLLARPSVRVQSLERLEEAGPAAAHFDWLLDLDSRWVPRPPAWLEGRRGTLSVKDAGRGPLWRVSLATAVSLARRVGCVSAAGWVDLAERYRTVDPGDLPVPGPAGIARRLRSARAPMRVALSPGGVSPREKLWPPASVARVVLGLLEVGCDVLILGDRRDARLGRDLAGIAAVGKRGASGRVVDLTGRTRLEDVPGLLASADLHLACDNGLLHVGGALDRPQVGLYLGGASRHVTPGRRDRRLFAGRGLGMADLPVSRVARACGEVLAASIP
ncbi:MAG: glycosyltransferase family 9 protein [Acidobacteriota bacterium]